MVSWVPSWVCSQTLTGQLPLSVMIGLLLAGVHPLAPHGFSSSSGLAQAYSYGVESRTVMPKDSGGLVSLSRSVGQSEVTGPMEFKGGGNKLHLLMGEAAMSHDKGSDSGEAISQFIIPATTVEAFILQGEAQEWWETLTSQLREGAGCLRSTLGFGG